MSVMVIAAHPDDEVLGCGGVIAKFASERLPVDVVILGEGLSSRRASRDSVDKEGLNRLRDDARAANALIGSRSIVFAGLPDNRFDELPLLDVVKIVEDFVARSRPHTIYTHHPGDLNIDHGVTFRAVMTATRPLAATPVREVYAFEVASSTEWAFQRITPTFRPNVFVDISGTIDKKIEGMDLYESERRPFPHPRSAEALRAAARRWGSVCGVECAEAFELIRSIR